MHNIGDKVIIRKWADNPSMWDNGGFMMSQAGKTLTILSRNGPFYQLKEWPAYLWRSIDLICTKTSANNPNLAFRIKQEIGISGKNLAS